MSNRVSVKIAAVPVRQKMTTKERVEFVAETVSSVIQHQLRVKASSITLTRVAAYASRHLVSDNAMQPENAEAFVALCDDIANNAVQAVADVLLSGEDY